MSAPTAAALAIALDINRPAGGRAITPPATNTPLARFRRAGRTREIVTITDAGATLVVDREALGHGDARLLARLEPDEPSENAVLVARLYLRTPRTCGRLAATYSEPLTEPRRGRPPRPLAGQSGQRYWLAPHPGVHDELHWITSRQERGEPALVAVTVREVVGALEAYQPAFAMSEYLIATTSPRRHRALAHELEVVRNSTIRLNRRLREVVLAEEARGTSRSTIAQRCGRLRRNSAGQAVAGETSWLARRIGVSPEAGTSIPTPWVRSDVLALIARDGLGVAPREVEVAVDLID